MLWLALGHGHESESREEEFRWGLRAVHAASVRVLLICALRSLLRGSRTIRYTAQSYLENPYQTAFPLPVPSPDVSHSHRPLVLG